MSNTYRYPIKCLDCGLHFNVYSWEADWVTKHAPYCPECGTRGAFVLGREALDTEIFEHVSAVVTLTP